MFLPNKMQRDLSNYVKLSEDYLVSQNVLEDDNYNIVQKIEILFGGIDRINPRIEIDILTLS